MPETATAEEIVEEELLGRLTAKSNIMKKSGKTTFFF